MKRPLLAAPLIALSVASAASAQVNRDQAAVIAQERNWSDAFLAHDLRRLDAILSDDFIGIDGRGVVSTKADELNEAEAPKPGETGPRLVREDYSDMKVRLYGRTAVLTDVNAATFDNNGSSRVIRYRRTTVWVKTRAGWHCVSFHASRIIDRPT